MNPDTRMRLERIDAHIASLRAEALALRREAEDVEALVRNADRILASVRMLELNISDILGRPVSLASWENGDAGA